MRNLGKWSDKHGEHDARHCGSTSVARGGSGLTGRVSRPTRRAFVAIGAAMLACNLWAPAAARNAPSDATRYLAWQLGSQLSMAAILYDRGASSTTVNKYRKRALMAARQFQAEIPSIPSKSGQAAKDSARILHFLLRTAPDKIGAKIRSRYPQDHSLLFELAIKSNILLLIYVPGEKTGRAIADVIRDRAPNAGIPHTIWKPVVDSVRTNAPSKAVNRSVVRMHRQVGNLFLPRR